MGRNFRKLIQASVWKRKKQRQMNPFIKPFKYFMVKVRHEHCPKKKRGEYGGDLLKRPIGGRMATAWWKSKCGGKGRVNI